MLNQSMKLTSKPDSLLERFQSTRRLSLEICTPLEAEDFTIQSMPDVSPPKWHLAHTSWFFETFILLPYLTDYRLFDPDFPFLFNSYYQTVGKFHPRPQRGNLSRPSHKIILQYRQAVDQAIQELIAQASEEHWPQVAELIEVGIHHEQQHQELLLMDIKYNFFSNPIYPAYLPSPLTEADSQFPAGQERPLEWLFLKAGQYEVGARAESFAYDNELPRHRVFVEDVLLADRLVSNAEYLEFIQDGGYERVELWLSEGWNTIQCQNIKHPLYWIKDKDQFFEFTLYGLEALDLARPVIHINYFEADAFARWKGCRLPSEYEWESLTQEASLEGHFLDFKELRPKACHARACQQFFGDAWEWTASSYGPYPGFKPKQGALGEYNGKFMVNQYVLRGGSCITSPGHIRHSYRNFFPAGSRWMFSGIRLAKEV